MFYKLLIRTSLYSLHAILNDIHRINALSAHHSTFTSVIRIILSRSKNPEMSSRQRLSNSSRNRFLPARNQAVSEHRTAMQEMAFLHKDKSGATSMLEYRAKPFNRRWKASRESDLQPPTKEHLRIPKEEPMDKSMAERDGRDNLGKRHSNRGCQRQVHIGVETRPWFSPNKYDTTSGRPADDQLTPEVQSLAGRFIPNVDQYESTFEEQRYTRNSSVRPGQGHPVSNKIPTFTGTSCEINRDSCDSHKILSQNNSHHNIPDAVTSQSSPYCDRKEHQHAKREYEKHRSRSDSYLRHGNISSSNFNDSQLFSRKRQSQTTHFTYRWMKNGPSYRVHNGNEAMEVHSSSYFQQIPQEQRGDGKADIHEFSPGASRNPKQSDHWRADKNRPDQNYLNGSSISFMGIPGRYKSPEMKNIKKKDDVIECCDISNQPSGYHKAELEMCSANVDHLSRKRKLCHPYFPSDVYHVAGKNHLKKPKICDEEKKDLEKKMMDVATVENLFFNALQIVLRYRTPPFNVSAISDCMADITNDWSVKTTKFGTFSRLCQEFESRQLICTFRKGDCFLLKSTNIFPPDLTLKARSRRDLSARKRREEDIQITKQLYESGGLKVPSSVVAYISKLDCNQMISDKHNNETTKIETSVHCYEVQNMNGDDAGDGVHEYKHLLQGPDNQLHDNGFATLSGNTTHVFPSDTQGAKRLEQSVHNDSKAPKCDSA